MSAAELRSHLVAIAQAFEAAGCRAVGIRLRALPDVDGDGTLWFARLREATAVAIDTAHRVRDVEQKRISWRRVAKALDTHGAAIALALGQDEERVITDEAQSHRRAA